MATESLAIPLLAIVGPTASGKTSLAIKLAKQFNGEIICADSRTLYKGMDIGTAKPTDIEQATVPHWGLDLVLPGEHFSAADFKQYTVQKIAEIRNRGHIPILVGGTGLYIDSVIFDYQFGPVADVTVRAQFESMSLEQLYKYCKNNNVILPENYKNKRYVVRAIEQGNINNARLSNLLDNTIVVGITTDKEILRTRIATRTEQLFEDGVVNEAKQLGKIYGWDSEAMKGNIYPLVRALLDGNMSLLEIKLKNNVMDWHLAKRQLTWLRRNPFINWYSLSEAFIYLEQRLANRE